MAKVIRAVDVTEAEIHMPLWLKVQSVILPIAYTIVPLDLFLDESNGLVFLFLRVMSLVLYVGFFSLCMNAFIWYQVNDDGIRRHGNIFRLNFLVKWEDIERIVRKGQRPVYHIFLRNGSKMGFIPTTSGTSAFIILAKRHLPWEKWAMAFGEESPTDVSSL